MRSFQKQIMQRLNSETVMPLQRLTPLVELLLERGTSFDEIEQDIQETVVILALYKTNWNQSGAAKLLKCHRNRVGRNVRSWLRKREEVRP